MGQKPCYAARLQLPIQGAIGPLADRYLEALGERGKALTTRYEYHRDLDALGRLYPDVDPEDMTTALLESFLMEQTRGKAANTKRKAYAILSGFFGYLHERGFIPTNPTLPLVAPSRPEPEPTFWTPEDICRILSVPLALTEHVCLCVLAYTGQRAGVVRDIQWHHIDLPERVINFPRGKQGKFHTIAIPAALVAKLTALYRRRPHAPEDYLFTSRQGTPFSQQTLARITDKACRKAAVRRATPHEFRRSCITNLLRAGVEFTVVSKGVAGHSNPATTLRHYRGITNAEVGTALDRLAY